MLCPGLLAVQNASCAALADADAVAVLLAPLVQQRFIIERIESGWPQLADVGVVVADASAAMVKAAIVRQ